MNQPKNIGTWFANFSTKYRLLVVPFTILFVLAAAYGAQFLQLSTNYRVFFSHDNPNLLAFEELQNVYTRADNVFFVLKSKDGDAFNVNTLEAVQELTEEAWQLPYTTRVDSVTNFQHTEAEEDDLIVADLVEEAPSSYSADELKRLKNIAMTEPLLAGRLISKDGSTTGVNVTMTLTGKDPMEGIKIAEAARVLEGKLKAKYENVEFAISGIAMMNASFQEASFKDMQTLVPLMYLLLFVAIAVFLKSFWATLITLFLGLLSIIAAMGTGGWFGYPMTPPVSMVPTIVLTLAVADSIHIFTSFFKAMQQGMNKREAIVESVRLNFSPIMLTSVTTAVGFLALNFSDAPPFHHLGNMAATGVMVAFLLSVTLVPALMSFVPYKGVKSRSFIDGWMVALGEWVIKHRKKLLPGMSLLVVILAVQIPKIELNDEFVEYFDHTIDFRNDTDFMLENLTGLYQAEYSLGSKESGGINEPEYLKNLDKFVAWLNTQEEVEHVNSLLDIMKRLNKNMHGDDESYYKIPESRRLAAQYLLLYEMSLPYGLDLNDRVNIDKSATRVTVTLRNMSTKEMREFKYKSEAWLEENVPSYMHTKATSANLMFAYISKTNIDSMTRGNIVALVIISGLIMLTLASLRIGLFSMVPNLVPVAMAFGVWSLLYGQVNMAVAITMAVSLGIIVDDTVHFLSKYQRAIKEKGMDATEAVRYAFSTVGSALSITSVSLIAGFGIMILSAFQINSVFGALTTLSIGSAIIADFLLLPPLLIALDKRNRKETTK